jgi:hypothetical protein
LFRFLLKLEDGEPYDPSVFVTVIPSWSVGETFLVTAHERLRILAIDFDLDDELVDRGINAVFSNRAGMNVPRRRDSPLVLQPVQAAQR